MDETVLTRTNARAAKGEAVRARLGVWGRALLDQILPPVCLKCRVPVDAPGQLCSTCWQDITFLADPQCAVCGLPFPFETAPETQCAACIGDPPAYDRARAAMLYDEASRGLILAFKHGDRLEGAASFARWMMRAGAALVSPDSLLVPVPLHRWRLLHRRYNQAALLAQAIHRETGLAWDPRILRRVRATPSQGSLTAAGRRRNVAGAFVPHDDADLKLDGRRVILVDDVLTTGATVEACANVLRRGGAQRVDVLTLARTAQGRMPH